MRIFELIVHCITHVEKSHFFYGQKFGCFPFPSFSCLSFPFQNRIHRLFSVTVFIGGKQQKPSPKITSSSNKNKAQENWNLFLLYFFSLFLLSLCFLLFCLGFVYLRNTESEYFLSFFLSTECKKVLKTRKFLEEKIIVSLSVFKTGTCSETTCA